jgi:AcrR family transcriptional regulator
MIERLERKEREFNMRRTEILEKAEKIFSTKGFHKVTMAEIAVASGFSIGSLYQFFKGKENLYTTMVSEKLDLMYAEVKRATDDAEDISEKLEALIDAYLRFVETNTAFWRLFMKGESAAVSESITSLHQKLMEEYYKHLTLIEDLLDSGIQKGLLRDLPHKDIAQALFHLIKASSVEWMLIPAKESLISKKGLIMDIFLNGVKK